MSMFNQQAADPESGSFLLTMRLCLLLVGNSHEGLKREPNQIVSMLWLKMIS